MAGESSGGDRRTGPRGGRLLAVLLTASIVAAACGEDGDSGSENTLAQGSGQGSEHEEHGDFVEWVMGGDMVSLGQTVTVEAGSEPEGGLHVMHTGDGEGAATHTEASADTDGQTITANGPQHVGMPDGAEVLMEVPAGTTMAHLRVAGEDDISAVFTSEGILLTNPLDQGVGGSAQVGFVAMAGSSHN